MAKKKRKRRGKVHAPDSNVGTGEAINFPMCGTIAEEPTVAQLNGDAITCRACASALFGNAQWANQLHALGYRVEIPPAAPRKARGKADPRQTGFGDMLERDDR